MDNIVNHLAPTLMNLMRNQVMEERGPDGLLIRRQEIIGPGRFTMLIRCMDLPTRHLCGYALTPSDIQFSSEWAADGITLSYQGFGTREIGWRWFNSTKKLTTPGKVTPDGENDYWVGFDLSEHPEATESEALRVLTIFERAVGRIASHRK